MRNKQRPWLPESSWEDMPSAPAGMSMGNWDQEYEERRRNERVWQSNDYYRHSDGHIKKVTNAPFVNGRRWEKLQRGDMY